MQTPKDKDIFSNNNSIDNTLPDQIPPNSDNIDKNDSNPDNTPKPSNINKFIKNPNPQNNVPSNEGPAPGIMGSSTGQIPQKINDPRVNPISSSIYNPLIGGRNKKRSKKEAKEFPLDKVPEAFENKTESSPNSKVKAPRKYCTKNKISSVLNIKMMNRSNFSQSG